MAKKTKSYKYASTALEDRLSLQKKVRRSLWLLATTGIWTLNINFFVSFVSLAIEYNDYKKLKEKNAKNLYAETAGIDAAEVFRSDGDYNILAVSQQKADSLSHVLDELSVLNPLCAGFVRDLRDNKQRIFILPDTTKGFRTAETPWVNAYYQGGTIYISDSYLKELEYSIKDIKSRKKTMKQVYKSSNEDLLLKNIDLNYEQWHIFKALLHEGRHAQQSRVGVISKVYEFYGKNLLDFITANTWMEADASAYANFCLIFDNSNMRRDLKDGTQIDSIGIDKKRLSSDYYFSLYSNYKNKFENFSHIIEPKDLDKFQKDELPDTNKMQEFLDLFHKMSIPISYDGKKIKHLYGVLGNVKNSKDLYKLIFQGKGIKYPAKMNYLNDWSSVSYPNSIDNDGENIYSFTGNKALKYGDNATMKEYVLAILKHQRPELFLGKNIILPKVKDRD